jgi:hypothetical protein
VSGSLDASWRIAHRMVTRHQAYQFCQTKLLLTSGPATLSLGISESVASARVSYDRVSSTRKPNLSEVLSGRKSWECSRDLGSGGAFRLELNDDTPVGVDFEHVARPGRGGPVPRARGSARLRGPGADAARDRLGADLSPRVPRFQPPAGESGYFDVSIPSRDGKYDVRVYAFDRKFGEAPNPVRAAPGFCDEVNNVEPGPSIPDRMVADRARA